MATNSRVSESSSSKENEKFRWVVNDNDKKVVNLIKCITHHKTVMEFDKRDFNVDKVNALFGHVYAAIALPEQDRLDNNFIIREYTRIQEKVKSIRQTFTKAVFEGRQSGSCKILTTHYDELVQIWGGSPASEPLSYGVNTDDMNNEVNEDGFVLKQGVGDDGENNKIIMSQYHCKVQQQRLQTQAPLPTQVKTLNHCLEMWKWW